MSGLYFTWRRKWQPTPVFLPGEFRGQRSLVGCWPWGSHSQTQLKRLSMHWRRKWQLTPVFLPGEFQGQRSLWAAIYGLAQSQT